MIVGYWGCGNLSELESLFNQVLDNASEGKELQKVSYENKNCFGVLAGCNFISNPSINKEEVLVSAAGIPDLADAAIKFENQRL
ncbi:MAG: asparagine synthase, partial [Cyanobacteria bacterium J06643_5]